MDMMQKDDVYSSALLLRTDVRFDVNGREVESYENRSPLEFVTFADSSKNRSGKIVPRAIFELLVRESQSTEHVSKSLQIH